MLDIIKVIILGIVEGITEFLPISSTGHLIIASALLNMNFSAALEGTFEIFIQLGAVLAVVIFYRHDFIHQFKTVGSDPAVRRLWMGMIIGTIPAALTGILFRDYVKQVLFNPVVVAVSLIIGGVLFLIIERRPVRKEDLTTSVTDITIRQAVTIGLIQAIALIPGVSRSAMSIFGGLFSGLDRQTATKFSFYLAIPTLGGATLTDLLLSLSDINGNDLIYLGLGALVSGVVAWFVIGWLLRYIARSNFIPFGYYRIAAGVLVLLLASLSVL